MVDIGASEQGKRSDNGTMRDPVEPRLMHL
jgi:hypothetical protein